MFLMKKRDEKVNKNLGKGYSKRETTDLLPLRSLSCGDKRRVSFCALLVVVVNGD